MTLRAMVYLLDGGTCIACGAKHRPNAGVWAWQVHHCIKQQWLTEKHVDDMDLEHEAQLCILLCKGCHEAHEWRSRVVPYRVLPDRVKVACEGLGTWAVDRLMRYHRETEGRQS